MSEALKSITYKVTARFDDGLYDVDEDGNWRKIGPPNPPCRCLYCVTSRRGASAGLGNVRANR